MEASGQAYTEGTFRAVPDTSRCGGGNRGAGGAPYAAALNRAVRLDIHGEYNAFSHVLRGGSGAVRALVEDVFGSTLNDDEKAALLAPRLLILPTLRLRLGGTSKMPTHGLPKPPRAQ